MFDCFNSLRPNFADNDLVGRGQFKCICYSPKSSAVVVDLILAQEDTALVYDILIAASLGMGLQ